MCNFAVGDGFARNVIKVVLDDFGDEIDDALYFLSSGECVIFAESEEVDDGFWENNLADFEVDLFIFQNFDFFDPAADPYVLEDVNSNVYDIGFP
jgi:hypothetical protein